MAKPCEDCGKQKDNDYAKCYTCFEGGNKDKPKSPDNTESIILGQAINIAFSDEEVRKLDKEGRLNAIKEIRDEIKEIREKLL